MGKNKGNQNKKAVGIGRSVIRDRFGKKNKSGADTFLHTSDLNDGYEWGRLNLQSVTEQNNLEDFLSTAEMAGTEFTAEKLNIKFISRSTYTGIPHGEELKTITDLHKQHEKLLQIPRRPHWTKEMSASEVDLNEKTAFLEWRRTLAMLQETEGVVMTPYEKNLDFWRQLWRVIERSDIVVQIVDARNPLLFYCSDLEAYVGEIDQSKQCVLLINKADYLTQQQRESWSDHFTKQGVRVAFWSAIEETERQEAEDQEASEAQKEENADSEDSDSDEVDEKSAELDSETVNQDASCDIDDENNGDEAGIMDTTDAKGAKDTADCCGKPSEGMVMKGSDVDSSEQMDADHCDVKTDEHSGEVLEELSDCDAVEKSMCDCTVTETSDDTGAGHCTVTETSDDTGAGQCMDCSATSCLQNTSQIHTGPELLEFFRAIHTGSKVHEGLTTIGMVGYPNVGKSSTINAILKMKKVPVSATPGRTKHFQTLFVDKTMMLCDCPGLVFPSFVTTKADLIVNGILPIDQMRDHVPPASLICERIPRRVLTSTYGVVIPRPPEGEDPGRCPTAEEFLNAYGAMRGYMTARGVPDCPRASRYILKDYVNGKLLYCNPPPGDDPLTFNHYEGDEESELTSEAGLEQPTGSNVAPTSNIDKDFFSKNYSTVHSRTARSGGVDVGPGGAGSQASLTGKPWKKHNNRGKKEKMRRVYAHLDKH